jgi:hypothetical protein
MTDGQRHAKVPAELSRAGWQRTAAHVATAGQVTGRGASVSAALDDLGGALAAMAGRARTEPAFWWDADNQGLHVVVPDAVTGDSVAYMVMIADGTARLSVCTTGMAGPPSEALATAVGLERVTTKRTQAVSPSGEYDADGKPIPLSAFAGNPGNGSRPLPGPCTGHSPG